MKQKILQEIQKALLGSRRVKVTFRRDAAYDVKDLLGLADCGTISLQETKKNELIAAATCSRKWKEHNNRTTVVMFTEHFREKWFVDRMHRALEKIEVVE